MNAVSKLFLLFFLLGFSGVIYAQQAHLNKAQEQRSSYPIAGSHLLQKDHAMVSEYFRQHPDALRQMRLRKAAWSFVVGSQQTWKTLDFTESNVFENVPSTCRAVGTQCYVFVEDAVWNTKVTQTVVDSVTKAFDLSTPADPSKGIYQTNVDAFGSPPNVDADAKIIILILDIRDGYDGSGGYVAGYFHSLNELPKSTNSNSNEAEIYYLDCNPANLTTQAGLVDGMGTTAHEFQHMIHFNYDNNEISFVNEGCSLVAEVNAGYPLYSQSGFTGEPNHYLLDWRSNSDDVLKDYSRAARYMLYMRDQFGMGVFKPMVQSDNNGVAGINSALESIGTSLRFPDVTRNWLIANAVNNRTADTAYGYKYSDVASVAAKLYYNPNVPTASRTVQGYAADYLSYVNGSNLSVTFTLPSGSPLQIKAVKTGSGGTEVVDVAAGTEFQVPEFGSTISKVTFVVLNATLTTPANYSVQSSGTTAAVEMKYDITEPTGYLALDANDTVCVWFDGVPGARLDSVRVASRRNGTLKGGVWRYTGTLRPTPLGTPYAINITTSSATQAPAAGAEYPVPWNNWAKMDLTSHDIPISEPFAVAFICQGDATTQPRVMITESPLSETTTSYTYSTSGDVPNWYTFVNEQEEVYTYLIRAYASFIVDGVKQSVELLPAKFSLAQNYPNPFNPATTIRYGLPSASFVTLKVYDMLGREIATLVNEVKEAGEYTAAFNAVGLSSGVYYYTLQADNFVQTKKLLLVK